MTRQATRRRAAQGGIVAVAAALMIGTAVTPSQATPLDEAFDDTIAVALGTLSTAEIHAGDITDTAAGDAAVQRAVANGADVTSHVMRAYSFGKGTYLMPATTPFKVVRGLNAEGQTTFSVQPAATAADVPAQAGLAVPPSSAFKYNNDSSFTQDVGTWFREIYWTITFADNWRACSTCAANDYWRIHAKMRAAAKTGATSTQGFKRAWLEMDKQSGSTPTRFEPSSPEESVAGVANQTKTYGFGTNFSVNLGAPPVQVSGGVETSYGGSLTKSSENFHPIIRTQVGDGGSQWCRYESAEFTGSKIITSRVGVQVASNGSLGYWNFLIGMQDVTSSCPSQI